MENRSKFFICLMGPTASGKTNLSIELAKRIGGEIISVDSALIYQGMDIGTAKPTEEERCGIPHHLIDILDPRDSYSAANFRNDSLNLINEIFARGNIPILVGGTMLYFNALLGGISELPESKPEMRGELTEEMNKFGIEYLHKELREVDPTAADRIKPTDSQRILRALEVFRISGKSMTELTAESKRNELEIPNYQFAIMPREREILRERIAKRFESMVNDGFIDEVKNLMTREDLSPELPSIRCVGYRQCWSYLEGQIDREEMIYRATVATCQLAKRQITWLRGWKFPIDYLEMDNSNNLQMILERIGWSN